MSTPSRPFLVCLSGPQGAGKTFLADLIADNLRRHWRLNAERRSFADALRRMAVALTGDPGFSKTKSYPIGKVGMHVGGREILQILGTDIARTHFREDIWVWRLLKDKSNNLDILIIDDARFVNERDACNFSIYIDSRELIEQEGKAHPSESNLGDLAAMADIHVLREEGNYYSSLSKEGGATATQVRVREIAEMIRKALDDAKASEH